MRKTGLMVIAVTLAAVAVLTVLIALHDRRDRPISVLQEYGAPYAPNDPNGYKISPDGSKLIALGASGSTLTVWDRATKTSTRLFVSYWDANILDFSPNGRYLVLSGWALRIWDLQQGNGEPVYVLPLSDGWRFESAQQIALIEGSRIRQFDLTTGLFVD